MTDWFASHNSSYYNMIMDFANKSFSVIECDKILSLSTINSKNGELEIERLYKLSEVKFILNNNINDLVVKRCSQIIFNLTNKCNLSCIYCEKDTNNFDGDIDLKLAEYVIEKFSRNLLERHTISFYGGEPLLCFDKIRKIYSFGKRFGLENNIKFRYALTTNLSIKNRKILDWLANNEIDLLVSLDGPSHIHNRNRPSKIDSHSLVESNLNYLRVRYPEYFYNQIAINAVISYNSSVNDLKHIDDYFNSFFFKKEKISINIASNKKNNTNSFNESYLVQYVRDHLKHKRNLASSIILSSILDSRIKKIDDILNGYRQNDNKALIGQCIPFTVRMFVDNYGGMFPCEKSGVEKVSSVYNEFDQIASDIRHYLYPFIEMYFSECYKCYLKNWCGICVSSAYFDFTTKSIDKKFCIMKKKLFVDDLWLYAFINKTKES